MPPMLPSIRRAATASWPWLHAATQQLVSYSHQAAATTFPLAPGGLVNICCSGPATTVDISNGAEDAVSLQAHQQAARPVPSNEAPAAGNSSSDRFSVQLLGTARNPIVDIVETSVDGTSLAGAQLSAAIPSRFCGVSVSTAGGSVAVAQVQEAELQVVSRGGGVTVKRCRATNAAINTAREQGGRGGDVQVGELSASVLRVSSGGGAVSLGRVFGLEAELLSEGGDIGIAALYGKKAGLFTGGGVLSVGHMACDGLATVDSAGGRLTVDGLEGNASILSAGADIKVHLHEQFGHVFVDSSGGDVEAWISPAAAVTLQVAAARGIQLDPALKVTGELSSTTLQGVTAGTTSRAWPQQQPHWQPDHPHKVAAVEGEAGAHSSSSSSSIRRSGSSLDSSRLHRASGEVAGMAASSSISSNSSSGTAAHSGSLIHGGSSGSCSSSMRQLTINAGTGRVVLKAMGWMDGIRAKLQAQHSRTATGSR